MSLRINFLAATFFILLSKNVFGFPSENHSKVALRITGGVKAEDAEFPFMAGLEPSDRIGRTIRCVGSLISTTTVLTAGHCLAGMASVKITLGAKNITEQSTDKFKQTFHSNKFYVHPKFLMLYMTNDLGLIKLPYAAKLNDHVNVIPIPTDDKKTYAGEQGIVLGWGYTSDTAKSSDLSVLRYANNTILTNSKCIEGSRRLKLVIKNTNICQSGKGGKSGCVGDSGGPLVVDGVQVGLLSFSEGDCEIGNPTAFARLSKYIEWITAHK